MMMSRSTALAVFVIVLGLPLPGQGELQPLEIAFRNETGVTVNGLRLRFDIPLDPLNPVEATLGAGSLLPFSGVPVLVDERTIQFAGGSLPDGAVFPNGTLGILLRFRPLMPGAVPRIEEGAWQIGGIDSHGLFVSRIANDTDLTVDALDVLAFDASGAPLPTLDARGVPNPYAPLGCTVTSQALGGERHRITLGCPMSGSGSQSPVLQLTFASPAVPSGLAVRLRQGGQQVGSSLVLLDLSPSAVSAVGLRLTTNRPVNFLSPGNPSPLGTVVGLGTSVLDFCGTAVAPQGRLPIVTLTAVPFTGTDLALIGESWRDVVSDPLVPDLFCFSFDEGQSGPGTTTSNMIGGASAAATINGFDTSFSGQFGTGLTGRSGGTHVATGQPLDLSGGSWSIMYWIDVTRSTNPTAAQYVFADPLTSDLRSNINGGNTGSARLAGTGFPQVLIPDAVDPLVPHHVAFVFDGAAGVIRGYRDGVLSVTQTVTVTNFGVGSELWLGSHPSFGQTLREGTVIDEFRVYGRALTDVEVAEASDIFVLAHGVSPVYETNDAQAALTLGGVTGTHVCPALVTSNAGELLVAELESVNWGFPYDVLLAPTPLLPAGAGGTVLFDGQIVNVDLTSPATVLLLGGFQLPFVPTTFTLAPTASLGFVSQFVIAAPSMPSGFAVSAAAELKVGPSVGTPSVTIEAAGGNSYNNNGSAPFWRVIHSGTSLPITRVTFDASLSSNPDHGSLRFDVDEAMPGVGNLIFGDGAAPCDGTYWNGSDVGTGLIYDGLSTYVGYDMGTGCVGGNCGFIASSPYQSNLNEYRTLEYRFLPGYFFGNVFELDMDTDGGAGVSGRDMAGLHVSVEFLNGVVLSGTMEVDPSRQDAALLRL